MMLRRILQMVVVTASVAGCVLPPQQPARAPSVVNTSPPRCFTPKKCEAMWADAADALSLTSGMRVRLATSNRIETFVANDYGRMTGIVKKVPEGENGYVLRVQFECYRNVNCWDRMPDAINLFNLYFGPPEEPAK